MGDRPSGRKNVFRRTYALELAAFPSTKATIVDAIVTCAWGVMRGVDSTLDAREWVGGGAVRGA